MGTAPIPPWIARLDPLINWARRNSIRIMPFNTACCGIEFMAAFASKYDLARFGMEWLAFSPRQADVMVVGGRVPYKIAPVLRRIWDQMPQPKWSLAMGACACSGGMFDNYAIVQGADAIIPVDVYVPGCPPRPEDLIYGIMIIQEKIKGESVLNPVLREESPNAAGRPNFPPETLELISQPFGNSTRQNRISGIEETSVVGEHLPSYDNKCAHYAREN